MFPDRPQGLSGKTALEKTLMAEIHGPPELRRREKQLLLGQFRERVIKALTFEQVAEPGTYPEIRQAIKHTDAKKLIVSRKADLAAAADYINLARKQGLAFSTVDQPDFRGNIALVVAAKDAVEEQEVFIPTRSEKLASRGIPAEIINSPGRRLCSSCRSLLAAKAPEELINYPSAKWYSIFVRERCPCGKS